MKQDPVENTRKIISIITISGFMITFIIVAIIGMYAGDSPSEIVSVLSGIDGVLGTTIGLILGHYFSKPKENTSFEEDKVSNNDG